jgi:polyisoprenyl-teichoic acid--peptidoglycan teichoic acid transferase
VKRFDFSILVGFLGLFFGTFMIAVRLFPDAPPVQMAQQILREPEQIVEAPFHAVENFFIPDPVRVFGKDHVRVLIVGLDYDYDKLDQESSKQSRSDVIMAMYLDFKNHRIAELSIPRDMVATLPDGRRTKINQAQADGGIKESKEVIAGWLGIPPFDRYVILRIDTSKDLINALGGIDVHVKNSEALRGGGPNGPIDYDDTWGHLHIHLKPGLQHLDGEHAVGYARFRHDWCGDPCRIMRQQQVIHAVVDRIGHNSFNTLTHARQILEVVREDVQTDFQFREELAAVISLGHIEQSAVRTAQVPYIDSVYLPGYGDAIVPDKKKRRELVDAMLYAPEEKTAGPGPALAGTPNGIRVRIENGTNYPEIAERVAAVLRRRGFTVVAIAPSENPDVTSSLIESMPESTAALHRVYRTLASNIPGVRTWNQSDTVDDASDVTVVLGSDAAGMVP